MSRTIRDAALESRTACSRLKPSDSRLSRARARVATPPLSQAAPTKSTSSDENPASTSVVQKVHCVR